MPTPAYHARKDWREKLPPEKLILQRWSKKCDISDLYTLVKYSDAAPEAPDSQDANYIWVVNFTWISYQRFRCFFIKNINCISSSLYEIENDLDLPHVKIKIKFKYLDKPEIYDELIVSGSGPIYWQRYRNGTPLNQQSSVYTIGDFNEFLKTEKLNGDYIPGGNMSEAERLFKANMLEAANMLKAEFKTTYEFNPVYDKTITVPDYLAITVPDYPAEIVRLTKTGFYILVFSVIFASILFILPIGATFLALIPLWGIGLSSALFFIAGAFAQHHPEHHHTSKIL
jgi:hypothetical protein